MKQSSERTVPEISSIENTLYAAWATFYVWFHSFARKKWKDSNLIFMIRFDIACFGCMNLVWFDISEIGNVSQAKLQTLGCHLHQHTLPKRHVSLGKFSRVYLVFLNLWYTSQLVRRNLHSERKSHFNCLL